MLSFVFFFLEEGKTDGALPGVVGHCVGDEARLTFLCHLFDDSRLSDARRSDEQNRALADSGNPIALGGGIGAERAPDLLFCVFNVHIEKPRFRPGLFPGRVL